jgi:hypothetical protein
LRIEAVNQENKNINKNFKRQTTARKSASCYTYHNDWKWDTVEDCIKLVTFVKVGGCNNFNHDLMKVSKMPRKKKENVVVR